MRVLGLCLSFLMLAPAGDALAQRPKGRPRARTVRADTAAAMEADVRRLLKLTGVIEKELRSIDPMFENFKRQYPTVPENVWEEVKVEFKKSFEAEMITGLYIKVYSRHFSHAEVRQLVRFFESPIGKRLTAEQQQIEAELLLEGIERGIELGERLRDLLKAKGYTAPAT